MKANNKMQQLNKPMNLVVMSDDDCMKSLHFSNKSYDFMTSFVSFSKTTLP